MKKVLHLYLFLLPIPLFFDQTGALYNIEIDGVTSQVLPLSFICTIVIGVVVLFYQTRFDQPQAISILIACILFLLASIVREQAVFYPYLFLLYLLPQVFGYLVGRFAFNYISLPELLRYIWFGAVCFSMVEVVTLFVEYSVQSTFESRAMAPIFGVFSIYAAVTYYPLLLSLIFFSGLFVIKGLWIKYLGALFIFLAIVISAAREPIAVILVSVIIYFLCFKKRDSKFMLHVLLAIIFITLLFFIAIYYLDSLILMQKIFSLTSGSAEGMTAERASIGANFIAHNISASVFLIGHGFQPPLDILHSTPHNQWIELIYQGGIFYLLSVLIIFVAALRKCYQMGKDNPLYMVLFIMLLAVLLVSFNINVALRAPYTSVFIWLLIGYISCSPSKQLKDSSLGKAASR